MNPPRFGMRSERFGNTSNRHQGPYKRVLCVCSGGLLRSPTAAVVLAGEPFHYNTRACGLSHDYGLILLDDVLLTWAQEIVVFEKGQEMAVAHRLAQKELSTPIVNLNIPDRYEYRDPEMMELIVVRYQKEMQIA